MRYPFSFTVRARHDLPSPYFSVWSETCSPPTTHLHPPANLQCRMPPLQGEAARPRETPRQSHRTQALANGRWRQVFGSRTHKPRSDVKKTARGAVLGSPSGASSRVSPSPLRAAPLFSAFHMIPEPPSIPPPVPPPTCPCVQCQKSALLRAPKAAMGLNLRGFLDRFVGLWRGYGGGGITTECVPHIFLYSRCSGPVAHMMALCRIRPPVGTWTGFPRV